jgi:hypothetical protein
VQRLAAAECQRVHCRWNSSVTTEAATCMQSSARRIVGRMSGPGELFKKLTQLEEARCRPAPLG